MVVIGLGKNLLFKSILAHCVMSMLWKVVKGSIFVWKQCLGQTAGPKVEILKQRARSMKDLCALEDIKMSCHDGAHIESWVIIYCNLLHFMERSISRWRHDNDWTALVWNNIWPGVTEHRASEAKFIWLPIKVKYLNQYFADFIA